MKASVRFSQLLLLGLGVMLAADTVRQEPTPSVRPPKTPSVSAARQLGKQPLRFEANVGQSNSDAEFIARKPGAALFLSEGSATLALTANDKRTSITLDVEGGKSVKPVASTLLESKTNYLIGRDRSKWHRDIANYGTVTYPGVLDGVDLVYHGEEGQLEYDFVVAPGAEVSHVAMNIRGTTKLSLSQKGELEIGVDGGTLVQPKPRVFQRDEHGVAHDVDATYRLLDARRIGFEVASYDHARPLVIDPVIGYSTYLGGSGDEITGGIAADDAGNAYVVGAAGPHDFAPSTTVGPYCALHSQDDPFTCSPCDFANPTFPSCCSVAPTPACMLLGTTDIGHDSTPDAIKPSVVSNERDVFIAKLSSSGALVYYTYLGGSDDDSASGVALDGQGLPVLSVTTQSYDFPWTTGGEQLHGNSDAVVVQMNASGDNVDFAVSVGQDATVGVNPPCPDGECYYFDDTASAVAVSGNTAYIGGTSQPTGEGCGECSYGAFVSQISLLEGVSNFRPLGQYGTSYVNGVAVDASHVYVAGQDQGNDLGLELTGSQTAYGDVQSAAYLLKLDQDLDFTWGTYYRESGGNPSGAASANAVAVDTNGHAYITGIATCTGHVVQLLGEGPCMYPTPNGYQTTFAGNGDAFVAKFDTTITGTPSLVYATLLGGAESDYDTGTAIAIDALGHAFVAGYTTASDFPTLPQTAPTATGLDAFATELDPTGAQLVFSSKFGGSNGDQATGIAVNTGGVFIAGQTYSTDFYTSPGAYQSALNTPANQNADSFVLKLTTPPLDLEPASQSVAAGASITFTATGGAGTGYSYAISTNGSGATIDSASGLYVAGVVAGTDIITVTDAAANVASARVVVNATAPADLAISPSTANTPPNGNITFTATGGTPPYSFDMASNGSNGSVSSAGLYKAGARGNVVDTVRVTDQAGVVRQATIRVGPSIAITPNGAAVAAGSTTDFHASGGFGGSYAWSATAGTITASGVYTAPASASVATISVRDTLGNTASVSVSVGGAVAVTPSGASTYPRGVVQFQAIGGSKSGFKWTLATNLSGGTIELTSGLYTAGPKGSSQDTVEVTDANGNKAAAVVNVGPNLTVNPPSASAKANGQVNFSAAGGSGAGYTFAMVAAPSGGSISQAGVYTAGKKGGTDVVKVTDSAGNTAQASVNAEAAPGSSSSSSSGGSSSGASSSNGDVSVPTVDAGAGQNIDIRVGGSGGGDGCTTAGGSGASGLGGGILIGLALLARSRRRRAT